MALILSALLVFVVSIIIFPLVFLFAINNGNIKVTSEVEELINKVPFCNIKNEANKEKKD